MQAPGEIDLAKCRKKLTVHGYIAVFCPSHPNASWGNVPEHRLVMEQAIGRFLRPEENVHHKNGLRTDNRLENLEIWSTSQPSGQRVVDKIDWCREFLAAYGLEVRPVLRRVRATGTDQLGLFEP